MESKVKTSKNFIEFGDERKIHSRINPGRYISFSPARIMFVWDFPTLN